MSLAQEIFSELWNTELRYKGVPVNIFGIPKFNTYKRKTLQQSLNRLYNQGYIIKGENGVRLTRPGKNYVQKKMKSLRDFAKPANQSKDKTLLVMFDIPESMKIHREWFRWHLKKFDYMMIQKSVWVGPDPLPKEFFEYTKEIGLKDCIKTFKLASAYSFKK